jgi:hypothetical protein
VAYTTSYSRLTKVTGKYRPSFNEVTKLLEEKQFRRREHLDAANKRSSWLVRNGTGSDNFVSTRCFHVVAGAICQGFGRRGNSAKMSIRQPCHGTVPAKGSSTKGGPNGPG